MKAKCSSLSDEYPRVYLGAPGILSRLFWKYRVADNLLYCIAYMYTCTRRPS